MPFVNTCAPVTVTPRELCVRFPVGQQVCASLPQISQIDPSEMILALFQQVNSAAAPLSPIFNIIDAALALFDCVKAVPDAITKLDPTGMIECLPDLVKSIDKLLQLIPQLSLPIMIIDIFDALIFFFDTQIAQLERMKLKFNRLAEAATKAEDPGQFVLKIAVDCMNANFALDLQNMNEAFKPVNRLIGIINAFLEILGLPCIPTIGTVTTGLDLFIDVLETLVEVLQAIRAAIPLPPSGSLPSAGEDC